MVPHAAHYTRSEYKAVPGRIGIQGCPWQASALRPALQTRECILRRDKAATSICTAQVPLAVSGFYVWGVPLRPDGLKRIAENVHFDCNPGRRTESTMGIGSETFLDTVRVELGQGFRSQNFSRNSRSFCSVTLIYDKI